MSVEVGRRFERSAPTYGAWARVHEQVAARLVEFALPGDTEVRDILEIGCGTGILTALALRRYPSARLVAVDLASSMVRATLASCGGKGRVSGVVADARTFSTQRRFDALISSAALHWALPLGGTFGNLARLLRRNGFLAAALMIDGTLRELREARCRLDPGMAPMGALPSREAVIESVSKAGLDIVATRSESIRVTYGSGAEFMRSLHEQGLNGGSVSRGKRPLTRGELRRLAGIYDRDYAETGGGVYATFEVIYVAARAAGRAEAPA